MKRKDQQESVDTARPYAVRAVDRVIDVLDALGAAPDGASLGDVSGAVDLPKSSTFRYLRTLEDRGYVVRDPMNAKFRLDPSFFDRPSLRALVTCARPHLDSLRDRFRETVNLGTLDRTRVLYVAIAESARGIRFSVTPGTRDPIHCTALGKALAAELSDDAVRKILEREGMPRLTSSTILSAEVFLREVDEVRQRGWALDDGENEEGGRCVAVPLPAGGIPAAISLSAPATRLAPESVPEIARALMEVATRIANEMRETGEPSQS